VTLYCRYINIRALTFENLCQYHVPGDYLGGDGGVESDYDAVRERERKSVCVCVCFVCVCVCVCVCVFVCVNLNLQYPPQTQPKPNRNPFNPA
jgi:hypothetical protein